MALTVNTNVSSLNAQRQLMTSGNRLDQAFERLSSGFRINSASDDAAGLQISNRLDGQINGLNQGIRNANDGISLAQTAEGAMDEITNSFQRVRTLASQAANGSNNDEDRLAIQEEIRSLMTEVNRIAKDTTFGGQNLLDGTYGASFQVGADAEQTISFSMTSVGGQDIDAADNGFSLSGIASIASAVTNEGLSDKVANLSATYTSFENVFKADTISVSTQARAQAVLGGMDNLIAVVDKKRSELGAVQNRFQSSINNQANVSENLSAAKSRIKDADFAAETAKLTQNQILQQASQTILAQANQRPQAALSLLQG